LLRKQNKISMINTKILVAAFFGVLICLYYMGLYNTKFVWSHGFVLFGSHILRRLIVIVFCKHWNIKTGKLSHPQVHNHLRWPSQIIHLTLWDWRKMSLSTSTLILLFISATTKSMHFIFLVTRSHCKYLTDWWAQL
jgi:dipeptide/tripeptide permease